MESENRLKKKIVLVQVILPVHWQPSWRWWEKSSSDLLGKQYPTSPLCICWQAKKFRRRWFPQTDIFLSHLTAIVFSFSGSPTWKGNDFIFGKFNSVQFIFTSSCSSEVKPCFSSLSEPMWLTRWRHCFFPSCLDISHGHNLVFLKQRCIYVS